MPDVYTHAFQHTLVITTDAHRKHIGKNKNKEKTNAHTYYMRKCAQKPCKNQKKEIFWHGDVEGGGKAKQEQEPQRQEQDSACVRVAYVDAQAVVQAEWHFVQLRQSCAKMKYEYLADLCGLNTNM
jgi:hypothetical protein